MNGIFCQCINDNHTSAFPSLCVLGRVWIFVSGYWLGGFSPLFVLILYVYLAPWQQVNLSTSVNTEVTEDGNRSFLCSFDLTPFSLVIGVGFFCLCVCLFLNLQCSWNVVYFFMLHEILMLSMLLLSYHIEVTSRMYVSSYI